MSDANDLPWTSREHEFVLRLLREPSNLLGEPRPRLTEERVAAARLFVSEFLHLYVGISPEIALAAFRAGHLTVADAQSDGIVPAEARWRCARGVGEFVRGPPRLSDAGPPRSRSTSLETRLRGLRVWPICNVNSALLRRAV